MIPLIIKILTVLTGIAFGIYCQLKTGLPISDVSRKGGGK